MHCSEIGAFGFLDVDQFALAPESDFKKFLIKRMNTKINLFSWISVDLELNRVDGNLSIRVDGSIHSEAENIFC